MCSSVTFSMQPRDWTTKHLSEKLKEEIRWGIRHGGSGSRDKGLQQNHKNNRCIWKQKRLIWERKTKETSRKFLYYGYLPTGKPKPIRLIALLSVLIKIMMGWWNSSPLTEELNRVVVSSKYYCWHYCSQPEAFGEKQGFMLDLSQTTIRTQEPNLGPIKRGGPSTKQTEPWFLFMSSDIFRLSDF